MSHKNQMWTPDGRTRLVLEDFLIFTDLDMYYKQYRYEYYPSSYGFNDGYFVRVFKKYGKICLYKFLVSRQIYKTAKETIENALKNLI